MPKYMRGHVKESEHPLLARFTSSYIGDYVIIKYKVKVFVCHGDSDGPYTEFPILVYSRPQGMVSVPMQQPMMQVAPQMMPQNMP